MTSRRLGCLAVLAAVLAAPGCMSGAVSSADRSDWTLVAVEFHPEYAANAGIVPVFERNSVTAFSGGPIAYGALRISMTGRAVCEVRFEERVAGLGGRQGLQRYEVVNFTGQRAEDGFRFVAPAEASKGAPLGYVTELHLERDSNTRLKARPSTGAHLSPYVFVFGSDVALERPVAIPFAK